MGAFQSAVVSSFWGGVPTTGCILFLVAVGAIVWWVLTRRNRA